MRWINGFRCSNSKITLLILDPTIIFVKKERKGIDDLAIKLVEIEKHVIEGLVSLLLK